MHAAYEVPGSRSRRHPHRRDVDLIIIPIAPDHVAAAAQRYDAPLARTCDRRSSVVIPWQANEIYVASVPTGWRASRVVFVGGGLRAEITVERFRRMAAPRRDRAQSEAARIGWADLDLAGSPRRRARDHRGGTGARQFRQRRAQEPQGSAILHSRSVIFTPEAAIAAVARARMGESINAARRLINEPATTSRRE